MKRTFLPLYLMLLSISFVGCDNRTVGFNSRFEMYGFALPLAENKGTRVVVEKLDWMGQQEETAPEPRMVFFNALTGILMFGLRAYTTDLFAYSDWVLPNQFSPTDLMINGKQLQLDRLMGLNTDGGQDLGLQYGTMAILESRSRQGRQAKATVRLPAAVTLLSPQDTATFKVDEKVTFSWKESQTADFHLLVFYDPKFPGQLTLWPAERGETTHVDETFTSVPGAKRVVLFACNGASAKRGDFGSAVQDNVDGTDAGLFLGMSGTSVSVTITE